MCTRAPVPKAHWPHPTHVFLCAHPPSLLELPVPQGSLCHVQGDVGGRRGGSPALSLSLDLPPRAQMGSHSARCLGWGFRSSSWWQGTCQAGPCCPETLGGSPAFLSPFLSSHCGTVVADPRLSHGVPQDLLPQMTLGTGVGTGSQPPQTSASQPRACPWHRLAWSLGVHALGGVGELRG